MKDYLLINLDNLLIEEIFSAETNGCEILLGMVFGLLANKARQESSIELEEETVGIIEWTNGERIDNEPSGVSIISLPMFKADQNKLLEKLKKYYDEYQPVKEKWESGESDDDEDYIVLQHMASNYEDIKFMVESAGPFKTPVVVAF